MLELDPPEFTGPSASCDRNNNDGNDRRCSSSRAILLPPRSPTAIVAAAISPFRFPEPVPPLPSFVVCRSPIVAAAYDDDNDDDDEEEEEEEKEEETVDRRRRSETPGTETRNATAFRVSCDSVCRSGVRPRISTLADILQKTSGDCRAAPQQRGNNLVAEGRRNDDTDADAGGDDCYDNCYDDNDDNDDDDDDDDDVDRVENFILSTSQESRSWPRHIGSKEPRTRKWWEDGDGDRAIIESLADPSGTRAASVTNVPPIDVSPYTAYNDENDDDASCCRVIGQSCRAIGNVRFAGREQELDPDCARRDGTRLGRDVGNRPSSDDDDDDDARQRVADDCGARERKLERFRDRDAGNGGERESHYTARFQKPTIANGNNENETKLSTKGPTTTTTTTTTTTKKRKKRTSSNSYGRKYGLLFVLYLLAWPLVSSTNPSGQFISGFTRNPSLGPVENVPRHNATQISSLLMVSSSIAHQRQQQQQQQYQQYQQQKQHYRQLEEEHGAREQLIRDNNGHHRRRHEEQQQQQQQQQQQEEQSREQREVEESSYRDNGETVLESESMHPYNEYSWEVNQINPWLSACDLAGPAPADLQGSCGPPEVPKTCPAACATSSRGGNDAEFVEVMEKVKVAGRNCYWSAGGKKGTATTRTTATSTSTTTTATASMVAAAAVAAVAAESGRFGSSSIKSSGADGGGGGSRFASEKTRGTDREKAAGGRDGVSMAPEQCLFYLEESHKRDICRDDFGRSNTPTPRENRYWFMSGLRLRHCCDHAVVNALAPGKGGPLENVLNGGEKCVDALDKLLLVDALAARLHCEFEEVLARYDCAQPYSVIFNCTHCKEAYRKWVCSSLVPYFAHGQPQDLNSSSSWAGSRLRPCRSFCQSVEQRCPYLLPGDRAPAYPTQYAGEPTFLCRDPNIPETGEQAARALHSSEENECCFHACSEELPGSGICANCTGHLPRRRGKSHDPPTAPRCEINSIQPASTGGGYQESPGLFTDSGLEGEGKLHETSREPGAASTPIDVGRREQGGTLVCGTGGGVDSIASVSSSDRSATYVLPQLFWLCSILISVLAVNVPTIPVLWMISRMFLWSSMAFGGGDDRDDAVAAIGGDGGDDDGSDGRRESEESRNQLEDDLVAWLCGCLRGVNHASVRYGANWLLRRWGAVERRCESWWWWCCWYWWWWRWRRTTRGKNGPRARWKFRPRRSRWKCLARRLVAGTSSRVVACIATTAAAIAAITATVVKHGSFFHLRMTYRDSFTERWIQRFLVDSFTVKCLRRRWNCGWRWWRSRWRTLENGGAEDTRQRNKKKRRRGGRRRRRRRRRKGRRSAGVSGFPEEESVVRSSLARRRRFQLFSRRKDPP